MKSLFAGILAAGAFSASFAASVESQVEKNVVQPVRQIVVQPTKNAIEPIVYNVFGGQLRVLKSDEADRLVVVSAPNCPPCRVQHKIADQLKKEGYNVEVVLVREYTGNESISGTPTLLYYNGNKLVSKNRGLQSYAEIIGTLKKSSND